MKSILVLCFIIVSSTFAKPIKLAVAANVSYAIQDLKSAFLYEYPKEKINITISSSGKLTAQIQHGAPYDIFLSANMKYPQALFEQNLTLQKPIIYGKGTLALLSVKNRDFSQKINILTEQEIKRIAIANPKLAPYGDAAIQALKKENIFNRVKKKFVYGESIGQTLSFTLQAADIGVVATSLLKSEKMKMYKENKNWIQIDTSLYTPISQGMVLLKKSSKNAKLFFDFLQTKKAKEILKQYGYEVNDD